MWWKWKKNTLIIDVKRYDIYKAIAEDIETRFGTSNVELNRSLPKGKNKKEFGLMEDEKCSYLKVNNNKNIETKGTKNVLWKEN